MANVTGVKLPKLVQGIIYGLERTPLGNRAPTHEWNAIPKERPVRIECIIASHGTGRVRVEIVKILDPTPEYLNSVDLVQMARLAREIVAEATGLEVARVTGDMIMPCARD